MKALGRIFLLAALSLFLSGCSFSENIGLAEAAVERFHEAFSAGDFDSILKNAVEEMNEPEKKKSALEFFIRAHTKLGAVVSAKQTNWFVKNSIGSDDRIDLAYDTTFENGTGKESFVFMIRGGQVLLWAYNLNTVEMFDTDNSLDT